MKQFKTKFEQHLEGIISNSIPSPKYPLWVDTAEGKIVGQCWYSIDYAFVAGVYPGWYYTLENRQIHCDHEIIHEDDIELV